VNAVEFRLLGSIDAHIDGQPVDLGHARQRRVLAALLVDAERLVPVDSLVHRVWGDDPPPRAHSTLYSYLSRLRRALSLAPNTTYIQRQPGGYVATVDPAVVDLHRFRQLVARARAADEPDHAAHLLEQALALWRGEPFTSADNPWFATQRETLLRERESAELDLIDFRLSRGEHRDVLDDLTTRSVANPLNERLVGQLMLALYRHGLRAEALAAYERTRVRLSDELGVDPSPPLRRLHLQILDTDPALAPTTPRESVAPYTDLAPEHGVQARTWSAPALLPPDIADFTGRVAETAALRGHLTVGWAGDRAGAMLVSTVVGMGGVGKTALALHVAHLVAESYPDGQLWVTLHGAEATPLRPGDVLARFLRAIGVPDRAIPADPVERAEVYRTLLAGRRVLVVLDNAASEEQVRPLLPGSATCAVVLTSRTRLTGIEGAQRIDLDVFPARDAMALLARVAGAGRVADEADAAAELVELCGGLPLGMRIAGARLAARPTWRLAHLVAMLRDERRRLDQLATGDLGVRASLALSYRGLGERPRRLFRLLGLFDVPDFPGWLAATILECSLEEGEAHAEALVDAQLLTVSGTDPAGQYRYRFHDLVRLVAAECAEAEESEEDRARALSRGLGGWLALAERMAATIPGPSYASVNGSAHRPPTDHILPGFRSEWAGNWFDAEYAALLAAVRQACRLCMDELAFDLAGCLEKFFDVRGMYADWTVINTEVMAVCRAAGNLLGEAVMLRGLIDVTTWITDDRGGDAMARQHAEATRLLAMFTELRHEPGMSDATVMCAWSMSATGAHADAIATATRALLLARRSGHIGGQVRSELALALAHFEKGELETALTHAGNALERARALGNARCEATALQFAGIGHCAAGNLDTSRRMLEQSLTIARSYRDNYTEVLTLLALARLHFQRGDPEARAAAEHAHRLSHEYTMSHHLATALGLLGEIELSDGRPARAVPYLEESVALWRTRGWYSYQAEALTALGRARAGTDTAGARAAYSEARALFDQLGDTARAAELAELVRSTEPRP
jgi:DNA-binding SARP family transcriptional activator/tetratricopeptide (TPR) repeat protein